MNGVVSAAFVRRDLEVKVKTAYNVVDERSDQQAESLLPVTYR